MNSIKSTVVLSDLAFQRSMKLTAHTGALNYIDILSSRCLILERLHAYAIKVSRMFWIFPKTIATAVVYNMHPHCRQRLMVYKSANWEKIRR